MNELIKQDDKARVEALDPTRSFIVQAPAGSGKTELLTQRYLKLLSRIHKGPEEIIAVTFTRKAAAQMRSRIVNALSDAKGRAEAPILPHAKLTWELAKAALQQCESKHWDIIAYPNQLRILTIDALCSHLASRMPILSHFGAEPEISTQPIILYQKAVSSLLAYFKKNTDEHSGFKVLLEQLDNRLDLAESLMVSLLAKRDQWLGHISQLKGHEGAMCSILEQGLERIIIERLERCYVAFKKAGLSESLMNLIQYLIHNLIEMNPEHPLCLLAECRALPEPTLDNVTVWLALQDLFMTQAGDFRKALTSQHGFLPLSKAKNKQEREERSFYKQQMEAMIEIASQIEPLYLALNSLSHLPPKKLSGEQSERLFALTQLLPLLTAHLILQFKESGTVDFIEVSLRSVAALGEEEGPTDLALSLDYQLQHLLIDEFQDTSFAQFHLFEKLVSGWSPQDGRTLFLVGDPMQSIYRFRGAEVGLFLDVQQNGLNGVELFPLKLARNFRSTTGVVEWVNTYFQNIFPAIEDRELGAVAYSSAVAANHQEDEAQSVYFYAEQDDKSKNLLDLIQILLYSNDKPGQSIAVLVRARHHLDDLLPLFRRYYIPFEAHDIEHLGLKQSILDLLSLTQALLDLSDKIAWLAILRAPWCGLALHDLTVLASDDSNQSLWSILLNYRNLSLSLDAKLRLERIIPILEYWLYHCQRQRLSAWIKGIWLALGGPACYPDTPILSEAHVFFELLDKESESGDLVSMALFEKRLSTLFAVGYLPLPTPDGINPIQLMTIHKSKGLEFDIVIVPALEKINRPSSSELLIWYERKYENGIDLIIAPRKADNQSIDMLYQHVNAQLSKKAELENTRLLYVAVTRAKKQIHLFGAVGDKAPASGSFLSYLWPKIEAQRVVMMSKKIDEVIEAEQPVGVLLKRLPADWPVPVSIPLISKEEPGDLNQPDNHYQVDKLIGIFVHRILQLIAELGLPHWDQRCLSQCIPSWTQGLKRLGIKPNDMHFALNTVTKAIQQVLKCAVGRRILGSEHSSAYTEWALYYQTPQGQKQIIIDRSFIDKNGIRWIIDYKLAGELTEDHCNQVIHYAKIVSQLENRNMQSIRCALYFPLKPSDACWKEIKLW